jgi:hypothetical protein
MSSQQPRARSAGWAVRVLPAALLILLAMAGLRGRLATARWNALHRDQGLVMCVVLMVVLVVLLVIMLLRRASALANAPTTATENGPLDTAGRLRSVLIFLLSAAIAGDIAAFIIGLHLKLPKGHPKPPPSVRGLGQATRPAVHLHPSTGSSLPVTDILYALLVIALIVALVWSLRWARRLRLALPAGDDEPIAEDPEDLRQAVESGRAALRTFDDAKAAIIACYLAMERSLAERGTARTAADTPDELLARAASSGAVRGGAARRLTQLFYEARFSSHPMGQGQREAAEQALSELAADLRAADSAAPAEAGT